MIVALSAVVMGVIIFPTETLVRDADLVLVGTIVDVESSRFRSTRIKIKPTRYLKGDDSQGVDTELVVFPGGNPGVDYFQNHRKSRTSMVFFLKFRPLAHSDSAEHELFRLTLVDAQRGAVPYDKKTESTILRTLKAVEETYRRLSGTNVIPTP